MPRRVVGSCPSKQRASLVPEKTSSAILEPERLGSNGLQRHRTLRTAPPWVSPNSDGPCETASERQAQRFDAKSKPFKRGSCGEGYSGNWNHTVNKGLRGIKSHCAVMLLLQLNAINFHHLLTPYLLQLVGSLALNSSIPMISMCPLYDLYPCSSTYLYPSVCKQETTKAASSSQRSWQRSTVEPDCSQTHWYTQQLITMRTPEIQNAQEDSPWLLPDFITSQFDIQ